MEESFQFRQMQKIRASLGEDHPDPDPELAPVPEAPAEYADVESEEELFAQEMFPEELFPEGGEAPPLEEREPRESIIARAEAALEAVAELIARDPELAALLEETRRERAAREAAAED